MNNLIIFDIDGTLINILSSEDKLYIDAVHQVLNSKFEINTDWHNYKYSTDSGVFSEIVINHFSRKATPLESEMFHKHFVGLLEDACTTDASLCRSIPGADSIFNKIKRIGWDVAIATGCWEQSAVLKLQKANISRDNIPFATSSDDFDRKKIIEVAIERAKSFYKKDNYQKIFYVGDKLWDKNAATALGIGFIGVGSNWSAFNKEFLYLEDYTCNKLTHHLEMITKS